MAPHVVPGPVAATLLPYCKVLSGPLKYGKVGGITIGPAQVDPNGEVQKLNGPVCKLLELVQLAVT